MEASNSSKPFPSYVFVKMQIPDDIFERCVIRFSSKKCFIIDFNEDKNLTIKVTKVKILCGICFYKNYCYGWENVNDETIYEQSINEHLQNIHKKYPDMNLESSESISIFNLRADSLDFSFLKEQIHAIVNFQIEDAKIKEITFPKQCQINFNFCDFNKYVLNNIRDILRNSHIISLDTYSEEILVQHVNMIDDVFDEKDIRGVRFMSYSQILVPFEQSSEDGSLVKSKIRNPMKSLIIINQGFEENYSDNFCDSEDIYDEETMTLLND